jgi:hypothetical protein
MPGFAIHCHDLLDLSALREVRETRIGMFIISTSKPFTAPLQSNHPTSDDKRRDDKRRDDKNRNNKKLPLPAGRQVLTFHAFCGTLFTAERSPPR